jgi:putative endonuclease
MKNSLGQDGEKVAANFLQNNGYQILALNYQNSSGRRLGEIDIIAKQKNELVFVEVKTRNFLKYRLTLPEENITPEKLRKINKIAQEYLRQNNLRACAYRFDAISVWLDYQTRRAKIKHLSHIFYS